MTNKPVTPAQLFGAQLAELRGSIGLTQRELVQRLDVRLGVKMDPATLARIEKADGKRVTLDEVFILAAGLGVSPLHLMAPREGAGSVKIGESAYNEYKVVRQWLRGEGPLDEPIEEVEIEWRLGELPDEPYLHGLDQREASVARLQGRADALLRGLQDARRAREDAMAALAHRQHEVDEHDADHSPETIADMQMRVEDMEGAVEVARGRESHYEREVEIVGAELDEARRDLEAWKRKMEEMGF